jgi:uncharacterized membrane protein YqjE
MSGLILMLVWPAGRAVAILAVLIVLVTHFLLGWLADSVAITSRLMFAGTRAECQGFAHRRILD